MVNIFYLISNYIIQFTGKGKAVRVWFVLHDWIRSKCGISYRVCTHLLINLIYIRHDVCRYCNVQSESILIRYQNIPLPHLFVDTHSTCPQKFCVSVRCSMMSTRNLSLRFWLHRDPNLMSGPWVLSCWRSSL